MSSLDCVVRAGWDAGRGKRGPALVKPETLARNHRPRLETGKLPHSRPGTPREGEYALGWGGMKLDRAKRPALTRDGSNVMSPAKIRFDPDRDLDVVVVTNIPEQKADDAASTIMRTRTCRYGTCA